MSYCHVCPGSIENGELYVTSTTISIDISIFPSMLSLVIFSLEWAFGMTFGGRWKEDDRTNINNRDNDANIGSFNVNAKHVPKASTAYQEVLPD